MLEVVVVVVDFFDVFVFVSVSRRGQRFLYIEDEFEKNINKYGMRVFVSHFDITVEPAIILSLIRFEAIYCCAEFSI